MNEFQVMGTVSNDPKVYEFEGGKKKAMFSISTSKKVGEKWIKQLVPVEAWGYNADKATTLSRGRGVFVKGGLNLNSYTDKTGEKKYTFKAVVDFLTDVPQYDFENKAETDFERNTTTQNGDWAKPGGGMSEENRKSMFKELHGILDGDNKESTDSNEEVLPF